MPRLICPTFWGQYKPEAICLNRHQQNSLLPRLAQGVVGYETTTQYSYLVRTDSVFNTTGIHIPDPEIALRDPVPGRIQGGGGFHGLRIR